MDLFTNNKSLGIILLSYFILLPFAFLSNVLDPFLLARQLLTTIVLFLILFILVKNKTADPVTIDKTVLLFSGFMLVCLFSFSKSQLLDLSHATLSKYLVYLLFFLFLRQLLIANRIEAKTIKTYVILFGCLSIMIASLAFLSKTIRGQNLFKQVHIMSGTFGNKNFLSSILFFCMPFYFIGISMSKKIKMASITAIIFSVTLLLLLRTRAVLIALSVFLLLVFLFQMKNKLSKKIFYWSLAIPATVIVIGICYLFSIQDDLHSSSNTSTQYFYRLLSSETFFSRMEYWKQSVFIITDNFFNGIGIGNWITVYPKYGLHHFTEPTIINGRLIITNPHNDFLMVFSEMGIFGFLFYVGIFVSILYQGYWLSRNEATSTDRKNATYFIFFIICYLIVAFFDFPLTRIEHQVVLFVVFSIISAQYAKANKAKVFRIPARLFYMSGFIILIYCTSVVLLRINGERHLFSALEAEKKSDHATAIFEFKKTKNSFVSTDNFAIPVDWHIGKALYNQGLLEESLQHYTEAYKLSPYSIIVNNDLGSTYIKNGNTTEGIKHYKEALAISPDYEDARINLAATYFNIKEYEKAFETIDKCNNKTKNDLYKPTLTAIVEAKLNATLIKINNQELNARLKSMITTEEKLLQFYFDYKKNKINFDEYILSLIH